MDKEERQKDNREMEINGSLICQDAMPDIVRCIESVAPLVKNYYIMDGGSTDGTWEWLNKYSDVYNLTLFQRKYDDQGKQRNALLKKIPKDTWVINIDQDEELNLAMRFEVKDFINKITPKLYTDPKRELPLTLSINNINLVEDRWHFDQKKMSYFAIKVFYNDKTLHFTEGYHMTICYEKERKYTNAIDAPQHWCIRHYAYLDKDRIKNPEIKGRHYDNSEFDPDTWVVSELPKPWKI